MPSRFYVVEKDGVPAVWQSDPKGMLRLLKHKAGFSVTADPPSNTRAEALNRLRQLFPGCRPAKASS
jgi:hypothetical protein